MQKSIGNQNQQALEDLGIDMKMQMIGIYLDLDVGEFHFQYGALKMGKKKSS